MNKLFLVIALSIATYGQAYEWYPVNSKPSFAPTSTVIRHQNGSTTYIQPNGPSSGCIRYQDGRVDYYGR